MLIVLVVDGFGKSERLLDLIRFSDEDFDTELEEGMRCVFDEMVVVCPEEILSLLLTVIPLLGNNDRLVVKFVLIFEDIFGVFFKFWLLGNKERLATKDEGTFGVDSLFGNNDLLVIKFVLTDEDDTLGVVVLVVFSRNFDCKLAGVFFVIAEEPFSLSF